MCREFSGYLEPYSARAKYFSFGITYCGNCWVWLQHLKYLCMEDKECQISCYANRIKKITVVFTQEKKQGKSSQLTLINCLRPEGGKEVPRRRSRFFAMRKRAAHPMSPPTAIEPQASKMWFPVRWVRLYHEKKREEREKMLCQHWQANKFATGEGSERP